jgi:hypothetical protein
VAHVHQPFGVDRKRRRRTPCIPARKSRPRGRFRPARSGRIVR